MTAAEISVLVFMFANSFRVFAYVLQMARVAQDSEGARCVSCTTWFLLSASNLTTVAYAILELDDWKLAAIFGVNSMCCAAILGLTIAKRAARRSSGSVRRRGMNAGAANSGSRAVGGLHRGDEGGQQVQARLLVEFLRPRSRAPTAPPSARGPREGAPEPRLHAGDGCAPRSSTST